MKVINFTLSVFVLSVLSTTVRADQLIDKTIVYIKCKAEFSNGEIKTSEGSGVLVSEDGKILTAKHVIPETKNVSCEGSIGNAYAAKEQLIITPVKSNIYDAALLQFSSTGKKFDFLKYCKLNDSFRKATIFSTGFPGGTKSGVPSSRIGVLSTVLSGSNGLIETDSATARGMSGGMVTLGNSSHLIGIIAGAEFDPGTGVPTYYGDLPVQGVAKDFGLLEEDEPCIRKSKLSEKFEWNSKMSSSSLDLGMKTDEGFCFLTDVWGVFDNKEDVIRVEVNSDNKFILIGSHDGGGTHGGAARCVWF